jgi:hypothetical protein
MTGSRPGSGAWRYEIRVRGRLGPVLCSAFPGLQARADGPDTVLAGVLDDQAALYAVLAQVESLRLELIDVRRQRPGAQEESPALGCAAGGRRASAPASDGARVRGVERSADTGIM